jgi:NDP-sugar pyrophosphorylase family protein
VIVNLHHFADKVVEYLERNGNFGMRIEVSREEVLLDTGGGLKQAAWFFLEDPGSAEPFLLHNVDVLSTIDFGRMLQSHRDRNALATLAVQERETFRYLLFDQDGRLCGRKAGRDLAPEMVRSSSPVQALAFSGVHVISPSLLSMMAERGTFSILTTYLRLAGRGEKILPFPADEYYWRDLGKPDSVAQAEQDVTEQLLRL